MLSRTRALLLGVLTAPVLGQSATQDQNSPDLGAVLNASPPQKLWQQEARAGDDGQLEGLRLYLAGPSGAHVDVRLRRGSGWSQDAVLWSGAYTKATDDLESPFFDTTDADLQFDQNEPFVIEVQGDGSGALVRGSYRDPAAGPAHYRRPLFLRGGDGYDDGGWRMAFTTWLYGVNSNYCTARFNSTGAAARMGYQGSTSLAANDLVLRATSVPQKQAGHFFYSLTKAREPYGNGWLCVGSPYHRTPAIPVVNNKLVFAVDYGQLGIGLQPGMRVNFQAYFRDKQAGGSGFNLSDGLMLEIEP